LKTAAEAIRERVLRGIALNREPGFFFSGNFLGLSFDTIATRDMRVSVEPGAHCIDPDGQANFAVLAMLADMALAGCIRAGLTLTTRLATVSMNLQLTGARIEGRLEAASNFQGFFGGRRRVLVAMSTHSRIPA
jgi:acyl-coenzyme A thioesterase PaaI-like protein